MSEKKWWLTEPIRIIKFPDKFDDFTKKIQTLKKLGGNAEHLINYAFKRGGSDLPEEIFHVPWDHSLEIDSVSLKKYLEHARKQKTRVIVYYNVHSENTKYIDLMPAWVQRKEDGIAVDNLYSRNTSFCINSPWRERVFKVVRDLASCGVDGIFFDGPIFLADTCYCTACKTAFQKKYGYELPSKTKLVSQRDNPQWYDLLEFQSESMHAFLAESNRVIKQANPDTLLYMNGNTISPDWPTGRNNRKIIEVTDMLGTEGGFLIGELRESIYKPGATSKLINGLAGGKPSVVFCATGHKPWNFSTLPAGEISILYSQTITHQSNVNISYSDDPECYPNEMKVLQKYNAFIKKYPELFINTASLASVALVWPAQTGNYYTGSEIPLTDFTKEMKAEKAGNVLEEFYGFYAILARNHVPFDVIDEKALENIDPKYKLVVFPNVACMSKNVVTGVKKFVNSGGNILSSFETSLYDEKGKKCKNLQLADVMGIQSVGTPFGPLNWDFIYAANPNHFSVKGLNKRNYIVSTIHGLNVTTKLAAPIKFYEPLLGRYAGAPKKSEKPFLIENKYGKGRSIFFAGTVGHALARFNLPDFYRITRNILKSLAGVEVKLTNTPTSIEITVRKSKETGDVYAYFVNFTSETKRPIEQIIPVHYVEVELKVKNKIQSVTALWSGKKLKFTQKGNTVKFVLPRIGEYEVVKITL
ncbi:MAG: beta-galactosidase trimerization domain-containing protein [Elusimicrobiota bacterium]